MLKCNASNSIKIIGIIQVLVAIIITSLGITITIKFAHVHHEKNSEYDHAIDYIDNPWTTKYGAGIWLGLMMCIAGAFGTFVDLKPHKSKYTWGFVLMNALVLILAIVITVYSVDAIDWYETCQFTEQLSKNKDLNIRDCSDKDKNDGKRLYTILLIATILALLVTMVALCFTIYRNRDLFEDCFKHGVYKAKGAGNTSVSFKTKNTHEFDQISVGPQPFSTYNDPQANSNPKIHYAEPNKQWPTKNIPKGNNNNTSRNSPRQHQEDIKQTSWPADPEESWATNAYV